MFVFLIRLVPKALFEYRTVVHVNLLAKQLQVTPRPLQPYELALQLPLPPEGASTCC